MQLKKTFVFKKKKLASKKKTLKKVFFFFFAFFMEYSFNKTHKSVVSTCVLIFVPYLKKKKNDKKQFF